MTVLSQKEPVIIQKETDETLLPNNEHRRYAEIFVLDAAFWSFWSGAIPVPWIDTLFTSTIQLKLVNELCSEYGVDFSESIVEAFIAALTTGGINGVLSYIVSRSLPGVGFFGVAAFSAISTYAVGQVFIRHFEAGGNLRDIHADHFKDYYHDMVAQGKDKILLRKTTKAI